MQKWNKTSEVPPPNWKLSLLASESDLALPWIRGKTNIEIGYTDPVVGKIMTVHGEIVYPEWWMEIPPLPEKEEENAELD